MTTSQHFWYVKKSLKNNNMNLFNIMTSKSSNVPLKYIQYHSSHVQLQFLLVEVVTAVVIFYLPATVSVRQNILLNPFKPPSLQQILSETSTILENKYSSTAQLRVCIFTINTPHHISHFSFLSWLGQFLVQGREKFYLGCFCSWWMQYNRVWTES